MLEIASSFSLTVKRFFPSVVLIVGSVVIMGHAWGLPSSPKFAWLVALHVQVGIPNILPSEQVQTDGIEMQARLSNENGQKAASQEHCRAQELVWLSGTARPDVHVTICYSFSERLPLPGQQNHDPVVVPV